MLSVSQMAKRISQPYEGYLPIKRFRFQSFDDGIKVDYLSSEYSAFASMQGTAVDYLTRVMSGSSLYEAFRISLLGADIVSDRDRAEEILTQIHGIDRDSVLAACKLVCYDVAYRRGVEFYNSSVLTPPDTIVRNIQIMVQRGLSFLKRHAPLICSGVTFEGGYTSIVSSGDGDFLTKDGLWDFKVSKDSLNSSESLQILMYYIMGIHSVHTAFKNIQTLGLFNPLKNESYEIDINNISDDVLKAVSHDVLGYNIPDNPHHWREIDGEDKAVIESFTQSFIIENTDTDFNPCNYKDGIYDITVNDYWTYYRNKSDWTYVRPKFSKTKYIKFLKHDGFLMFVSVSPHGSMCILQGGFKRKLNKSIQYYYDNLPEYGNKILKAFSKYWDAIYEVSSYVKRVTGGQGYSRVHGCIVDIDFFNHIYINPIDGTITPYYADSPYMKKTYQNLASLLSAQLPHLLPAFQSEQSMNPNSLVLCDRKTPHKTLALTSQEIIEYSDIVYNTEMYSISNRLKALQLIYDHQLVAIWYDNIITPNAVLPISEKEIQYYTQRDEYFDNHLNDYINIVKDERNSSSRNVRFLIWETKCRITQYDLLAIIRKLIRDTVDDHEHYDRFLFGFDWYYRHYKYVNVDCSHEDIVVFYNQLLKPCKYYMNSITLHLEVTQEKKKAVDVSVSFSGSSNPLALTGEYKFENGSLKCIRKT